VPKIRAVVVEAREVGKVAPISREFDVDEIRHLVDPSDPNFDELQERVWVDESGEIQLPPAID
jgi:hypothetical protein